MHLEGKETFTADAHFGQTMCLSIIPFKGLTSRITRLSGGFTLLFDEEVVIVDGVVDAEEPNRFFGIFGVISSSLMLSSSFRKMFGDNSLAKGTLFALVRLGSGLLLPASLQVSDESSFFCSMDAFARHLVCLLALTLGDTIFYMNHDNDCINDWHQHTAKTAFLKIDRRSNDYFPK